MPGALRGSYAQQPSIEIIYILLDRQKVTAKELAERSFEVSVRTIYRDIDSLSFPVYRYMP